MRGPHNLGIKAVDIEAELAFLRACGATDIARGILQGPEGARDFGTAVLHGQRLLMFRRLLYEPGLPTPLRPGLAHAVFEVDDVDALLARLAAHGVAPLLGPQDRDTPFGRRRVVFHRSPSNFVLESFQSLK